MCDTLCKVGKNTTLFAKNSDREPDELQLVEYYPRSERTGKTKATYIEVEYVGETNAVVVSRPYWMWGAEMGVNEHGVAIGNQAIFSRRKQEEKALLGMDLVRLGLEKGRSAREALEAILHYLEAYGVGGSNSANHPLYYDNSFLIVDRNEGYILETEGKEYEFQRVEEADSISNYPRLRRYRLNTLYTVFGRGKERQLKSCSGLRRAETLEDVFGIMRSHHEGFTHPANGNNSDICMHGGFITRRFQTANSFVVEIMGKASIVWTTFANNPCISPYYPLVLRDGTIYGWLPGPEYWLQKAQQHLEICRLPPQAYLGQVAYTRSLQAEILGGFEPIRGRLKLGLEPEPQSLSSFEKYVLEKMRAQPATTPQKPMRLSLYGVWVSAQMRRLVSLRQRLASAAPASPLGAPQSMAQRAG